MIKSFDPETEIRFDFRVFSLQSSLKIVIFRPVPEFDFVTTYFEFFEVMLDFRLVVFNTEYRVVVVVITFGPLPVWDLPFKLI